MRAWLYYKPFVVKSDNNIDNNTNFIFCENKQMGMLRDCVIAWPSGNCVSVVVFFFLNKHYNAILKCGAERVFSVSGSWRIFHKLQFQQEILLISKNKLRFSDARNFKTQKLRFRKKKKLKCTLRAFIASAGSSFFWLISTINEGQMPVIRKYQYRRLTTKIKNK